MSKSNNTELEILLKISDKIDVLNMKIHQLEVDRIVSEATVQRILTKQEINLSEHMKRSQSLEDQMDMLQMEIKPVLHGLGFLKTIAKVVTFFAAVFGVYVKFKK